MNMMQELKRRVPKFKRGEWLVINTNGKETLHQGKPTNDEIYKAIGCDCYDTVTLTWKASRRPDVVMLVDDNGLYKNIPVNLKATALYMLRCGGVTPTGIHGTVAFVHDGDMG